MGDDGWLWALENRLRRFNYIGDLTTVRARVTATQVVDGRHVAEIEIHCTNQRGEDTAPGRVLVLLPSRADGPVRLPEPEEQMPWGAVDSGGGDAEAEGST